ncbi:MAG: cytochrome P460 family protein [Candidatus Competibacteraceae bacterium]|nr:cytochrome P460 family protein [Candidatus Competibacteraceae bacterium]
MKSKALSVAALSLALSGGLALTVTAQEGAPFGQEEDVNYADQLWNAMTEADLAGESPIRTVPYEGQHPHGAVLETLYQDDFTLEGHTGALVIKRNYGGEGVSKEAVSNNPNRYLGAVTIMYQREEGYDPENHNWFWAKYLPDGSLDKNPKGMPLAGRVAKGASQGCIACHSGAPGGDMLFTTNRFGD